MRGATWKLVNDGRNIRQRAFYYTHVAADPHDKDIVYALNVGTFRSTDGGKTMVSVRAAVTRTTCGSIPTTRITSCMRNDSGGGGVVQCGDAAADVDRARLSDGAVLSRRLDPSRAVSRLRRAAGQQHDLRAERHRASAVGGGGGWWRPRRRRRRHTAPAVPSRATSRRIRRMSTSSSPAATTARS